jgi:very-short-patch-repair endonuclease
LIRCKKNEKRILTHFSKGRGKGIPAWNKGLTKETDLRVKQNADNVKLYASGYVSPAQTSEYWTEERRQLKSAEKKELYASNPDAHPNRKLAGNRNKMTYPELVAYNWFCDNSIQVELQKKVDKFYTDFCVGNYIIEIDGEKWHEPGNEKDRLRDEVLTSLGYTVFRIRSKERIEERLKEIFNKL